MSTASEQFPGYYRHKSFRGVALYVSGYVQRWEPTTFLVEDPETGEEYEEETGEGENVDDPDAGVYVTMVGDDFKHHISDPRELVPIADNEFCDGCGQIGCGHGSQREA